MELLRTEAVWLTGLKLVPRVSIGLAVFNGENYIRAAIDSILDQTYTDFELIIVDNASTDKTQQICQEYEAMDKRVKYYRNKANIGAVANYNRAFHYSTGEYFKWAAHDDVLASEFLSNCVKVLDSDSTIVLCQTKTAEIDANGKILSIYNHKVKYDSPKPHERFGDFVLKNEDDASWTFIFGLMRSNLVRLTNLQGQFIGADINFLAEICLLGRFYEIPKVLFYRRYHDEAYSNKYILDKKMTYEKHIAWWLGQYKISFIRLERCLEYFRSVNHVPLKWSERLLSYAQILKWLAKIGWILIADEMLVFFLTHSRIGIKLSPFVIRIRQLLSRRK